MQIFGTYAAYMGNLKALYNQHKHSKETSSYICRYMVSNSDTVVPPLSGHRLTELSVIQTIEMQNPLSKILHANIDLHNYTNKRE